MVVLASRPLSFRQPTDSTRVLIVAAFVALLVGCASSPGAGTYISPGVTAPANSRIDVSAYNLEIERQGMDHYCPAGACDTLPALLIAYAPVYPRAELAAGTNGQAVIVFDVLEDGTTANFRVESATAGAFAQAAIAALKLWRFAPPTLDGQPIGISTRQSFPFDAR